jgi:DNA polymerase-3 subunit delta'
MKFATYLENKQPLVWKTFANSFKNGRIAHAYLLSGEAGTPLKETAFFMAKSLLCDHPNPLADEECRSCRRVDNGTYTDLLLLDGEEATIKKDDVQEVVDNFARTPLESKGVMIYIINMVENMTVEAVNSLLKFLEEPTKNTYAILTTRNEARILPTIVSRCERMRMLLAPREEVLQEAKLNGVALEDAELLAYFCNNGALIANEVQESDYQMAKTAFVASLTALQYPPEKAIFTFEKDIIPSLSSNTRGPTLIISKEDARYYLDMLSLAFRDLSALQEKRPINLTSYATLIEPLASKMPHLRESLLEIMKARGELDLNISIPLLLEHVAHSILKE